MSPTPSCGLDACDKPATYADVLGVGFCYRHRMSSLTGKTVKGAPFDPWWAAVSIGKAAGDRRWDGLVYGQYPQGVLP